MSARPLTLREALGLREHLPCRWCGQPISEYVNTGARDGRTWLHDDTAEPYCADTPLAEPLPDLVTPSRTDRQPPASASETKGGQGPAGSDA